MSPPTASKLLLDYSKKGLLLVQKDKNYIYYYANKNSKDFIDLSRIYWRNKLFNLVDFLNKNLLDQTVILFGSLSKAEVKIDSDVDLCVIAHKKDLNLNNFEKKIKRKIELRFFDSVNKINKGLVNNIVNGYVLNGRIKL